MLAIVAEDGGRGVADHPLGEPRVVPASNSAGVRAYKHDYLQPTYNQLATLHLAFKYGFFMNSAGADDLAELVDSLRRIGGEPTTVEVKSGAGGFPQSVRETLVAFANTSGGTVVIGVDEASGFEFVDIRDAATYRDQLVSISRDAVTPALHIETDIIEIDGKRILVAQVPPTPADLRPVYVTSKGVSTGAYIRTGDGDRRMTEAEIALVYSSRTQPIYDREAVEGAAYADLDRPAVLRTLERVRLGSAALRDSEDAVALHRLGVLAAPSLDSRPTLAGLLAYGAFPQQFFPQLMISVVVHAADSDSESRFLDNVTVRGSIPEMVAESLAVVRRNLAARAVVVDTGRTDHLDYPLDAIREAVVNAVLHRDYSPTTRGTQVQIELTGDKLVVRSPGGLFGALTEDDLGSIGISSSRNSVLANLLSDTYLPRSQQLVAENRASGIPTMIERARSRGLPRPIFDSSVTTFTVTMSRSALLGPNVKNWLASLRVPLPTPAHEIAVAMMRGGFVTNAAMREWGADRLAAGQVLRDLVENGVAVRQGGRRYARYVLDPSVMRRPAEIKVSSGRHESVEEAIAQMGEAGALELSKRAGISRVAVVKQLNALIERGSVRADGLPRSPKRRYVWLGHSNG